LEIKGFSQGHKEVQDEKNVIEEAAVMTLLCPNPSLEVCFLFLLF